MRHQPLKNSSTGDNLTLNNSLLIQNRKYPESSSDTVISYIITVECHFISHPDFLVYFLPASIWRVNIFSVTLFTTAVESGRSHTGLDIQAPKDVSIKH